MAKYNMKSFCNFPIIFFFIISFIGIKVYAISGSDTYFQQRVSYYIQVTLDIKRNMLLGHEKLTYVNNSPDTLNHVWFHLYPNAYKDENSVFAREQLDRGINDFYYTKESDRGNINIDRLHVNETPLRWEYKDGDESEMKVFLPGGLAPGDSMDFMMDFTVKIPILLSRLGYSKLHYEITQWYPKVAVYDNKGWHNDGYHILGEFYGDYGTFKVAITLPENMWVAASGVLTEEKEKTRLNEMLEYTKRLDGMSEEKLKQQLDSLKSANKQTEVKLNSNQIKLKTVTFTAENVHDFAWMCDYRYLVRKTEYQKTSIYIYVLPENYFAWKQTDEYARNAVEYMSQWYGPYIYPALSVVDSKNPHGGMEYPNLIQCAVKDYLGFRMLEQVVFHEIGHQWFYGMIGNNEMDDSWLDEGLTMFSEKRYFTEKYNGNFNTSWLMQTFLGDESTNHSELIKANLFSISSYNHNLPHASDIAYQYRSRVEFSNVYLRPAFALNMLQYILGDSTFNTAMRKYYSKYLLQHPSAKSLISVFNEATNKHWQWYFDQWIYSNKQCDYKAGELWSQNIGVNNYQTTFEVIRADSIIMPVTVEFKTEKDSIIRKQIFADKEVNVIEFSSAYKIISACIDPDRNLLEFNPRNNSTTSNRIRLGLILPTQSFYQNTLFITPWFLKNKFDGWGYGAASLFYNRLADLFGSESQVFGVSAFYYPQTSNLDYSFGFRSTTRLFKEFNNYYLKYKRWGGQRKVDLAMEYRLGKYKYQHPSHNFLLLISYDERYSESYQIQTGKDINLGFRYTLGLDRELSTHQFDLDVRKSIKTFGGEYDYTKVTLEGYNDFIVSRRFSITNFISAGMLEGTYPRQAALFLSPTDKIMFSDFGSWVGHRYFYEKTFSGGLAGYVNENLNGKYLLTVRTDLNIQTYMFHSVIEPFFLKIFFEAGKLWKSDNDFQSDHFIFFDGGIGFKWIGLDFAFSLWRNFKVENNGTDIVIKPDNRLAFNSFIFRFDLTYMYKMALGMK